MSARQQLAIGLESTHSPVDRHSISNDVTKPAAMIFSGGSYLDH